MSLAKNALSLKNKWSIKKSVLLLLLLVVLVWVIAYIAYQFDPTTSLKALFKLLWIVFAGVIVKKRGGDSAEIVKWLVITWLSTAFSILTLIALFYLLTNYSSDKALKRLLGIKGNVPTEEDFVRYLDKVVLKFYSRLEQLGEAGKVDEITGRLLWSLMNVSSHYVRSELQTLHKLRRESEVDLNYNIGYKSLMTSYWYTVCVLYVFIRKPFSKYHEGHGYSFSEEVLIKNLVAVSMFDEDFFFKSIDLLKSLKEEDYFTDGSLRIMDLLIAVQDLKDRVINTPELGFIKAPFSALTLTNLGITLLSHLVSEDSTHTT